MLLDSGKRLPKAHPVRFELRDSQGRLVVTMTRTSSVNGFYSFHTRTHPDAPTGSYVARVLVGGAVFQKVLKIETVMPNRLKINLDFGTEMIQAPETDIHATLSSTWLHGAIAKNLDADVEVTLKPMRTTFSRYSEYAFDDPSRTFAPESETVFSGPLNAQGEALVESELTAEGVAPGMLQALFKTRVFEPGGAFSVDRFSIPYAPYQRFVGIRAPKGDKARGMLLTDTKHKIQIVAVDPDGKPAGGGKVAVKLYKIKWRWWWEKGDESLADYVGTSSFREVQATWCRPRSWSSGVSTSGAPPSLGSTVARVPTSSRRTDCIHWHSAKPPSLAP